jgi:hypothetical protein
MNRYRFTILFLFIAFKSLSAQGFLHAEGNRIVDGSGENFIIRSIGTGNWMLQEGYMMNTVGIAGTQHEFREKLEQTIGKARTEDFYASWLENHFTRRDLDSMKAWGFNAIRPALHYKWFTLPVEEEPVTGEQTWLETGFRLTDSLVKWCSENEMYVIFDMHGAPGGQGKNADISDYDSLKLSLWESEANKTKLVALWYRIAERYSDEPWVGGYDLINETNWAFSESNNKPLRDLYERITDTIRQVDKNHILFIEGNWFANDFSGLTPPWDDNLVYSFHKYWTRNEPGSLDYATWLRRDFNVPLWLGESGENSNTWFTNLIALCEQENIGWSWWPVKKAGLNNVMRVKVNSDYTQMVNSWRGQADPLTPDDAYDAVMTFSENHRAENCIVQYDVIDAMIRQPSTTDLKPFRVYRIGDHVFATDYALGRNGYAYFDTDTANYSGEDEQYIAWNTGWQYRNDGVDIEQCSDPDTTNGYNVGWINDGEWMVYHIRTDSPVLVDAVFRTASASSGGYIVMEANGKVISDLVYLPATGSWSNWRSTTVRDLLLPGGDIELKVRFTRGGMNLNYFRFINPRTTDAAGFKPLLATTGEIRNEIILHLNKPLTTSSLSEGDFNVRIDGQLIAVTHFEAEAGEDRLTIVPAEILPPESEIKLTYSGSGGVFSGNDELPAFQNKIVLNAVAPFHEVPGKVEAESFYRISGLKLEECLDEGGGQNTGYASPGDYVDYILNVDRPGIYQVDMRVALQNGNAQIEFLVEQEGAFQLLQSPALLNTGGWQIWKTQYSSIHLPGGKVHLRLRSKMGEFNLNWLNFSLIAGSPKSPVSEDVLVFPNPASQEVIIRIPGETGNATLTLFNLAGKMLHFQDWNQSHVRIDTSWLAEGMYILRINGRRGTSSHPLMINKTL